MLLSISLLIPLFGCLIVAILPSQWPTTKRLFKYLPMNVAMFASLLNLFAAIAIVLVFDPSQDGYQLQTIWYTSIATGLGWTFAVDGLSINLYLLTIALFPIGIYFSHRSLFCGDHPSRQQAKLFYINLLLLEFGIQGVFLTTNLVAFYVFWELVLIPMVLLMGIWGGSNRHYATKKFFIYTFIGSIFLLLGIISIMLLKTEYDNPNFSFHILFSIKLLHKVHLEKYIFWAFMLSFLIKIPIFPLHTWLPHAHTEAPTVGSIILAGVLLKMGAYGILRFALGAFSHIAGTYTTFFMCIGVINIIYGAWLAWVQTDIKKLIAYSSVSHMGYIVMGMFCNNIEGLSGAYLQIINHGISTSLLFLLVGMIYDKTHTRNINDYGGLAQISPLYAIFFMLATLSSIGLPGTNGFVGEFLILLGTFMTNPVLAIFAVSGVIFGAVYMLNLYKKMFFAKPSDKLLSIHQSISLKMNFREICLALPLALAIIVLGIKPNLVLDLSLKTLKTILSSEITHHKAPKYDNN